jgi:hypothetical protein
MREKRRAASRPLMAALVGLLVFGVPAGAAAQVDGPGRGRPQPGVTPGELQQLFDAMVLMRAQEALQLSDQQYPQFLTRLKALQDVRRRSEIERNRRIQELRALAQGADAGREERIRERLAGLQELEERATGDARRALEALDQVLDVRQQALFRVFEEQMERQKLDLLTRARQANRQQNRF